jgi:nicotinate phosphoribosyltransferase
MGKLKLLETEREFLKISCPYLKPEYLDYLEAYRFQPNQVHIVFTPEDATEEPQEARGDEKRDFSGNPEVEGELDIETVGTWVSTILWEVPIMAALSESYFNCQDTDWDIEGQDGAPILYAMFAC